MQKLLHHVPRFIILFIIFGIIIAKFTGLHAVNVTYVNSTLPKQYNGFTIAHVNNIQNSGSITSKINKIKPDIILVTGDISSNGKSSSGVKTLEKLAKIAPTYYTLGVNDNSSIVNQVKSAKYIGGTSEVVAVENQMDAMQYIQDTYGDSVIKLIEDGDETALSYLEYTKAKLAEDSEKTINLVGISIGDEVSTDNELINIYSQSSDSVLDIGLVGSTNACSVISNYEIDLLLSGLTDDSQFNAGEYVKNGTTLLVSKGVNNKLYGEIQVITLSDGTLNDDNLLEKFLGLFIKDIGTVFDNDGGFQEYTYEYSNDEHRHF